MDPIPKFLLEKIDEIYDLLDQFIQKTADDLKFIKLRMCYYDIYDTNRHIKLALEMIDRRSHDDKDLELWQLSEKFCGIILDNCDNCSKRYFRMMFEWYILKEMDNLHEFICNYFKKRFKPYEFLESKHRELANDEI